MFLSPLRQVLNYFYSSPNKGNYIFKTSFETLNLPFIAQIEKLSTIYLNHKERGKTKPPRKKKKGAIPKSHQSSGQKQKLPFIAQMKKVSTL